MLERSRRLVGRIGILFLLASPLFARGTSWLVSQDGCPGTDFTDIQSAVDAASDGDVIFVRPAVVDLYDDVTISAKSLSLVGVPSPSAPDLVAVTRIVIEDLAEEQRVLLEGFELIGALRVYSCEGPVWVESCTIDPYMAVLIPKTVTRPAARIEDSDSVSFVRCSVTGDTIGLYYQGGTIPGKGLPSGAGLDVVRSSAHAYDTDFLGGLGAYGYGGYPYADGGAGGPGVQLESGSLFASGCTIEGGEGGFPDSLTGESNPGAGGNGLYLADAQCSATTLDTPLVGGIAGTPFCFCSPAPDGVPVAGPGAPNHVALSGSARSYALQQSGLVREGEPMVLQFAGLPGDLLFVGLSLDQEHEFFPEFDGTGLIGPPFVFFAGVLPASGQSSKQIPVNESIVDPGQALQLYSQAYFFEGVNLKVGPGEAFPIVDASEHPGLCQ